MELKDFVITPIVFLVVLSVAYLIRPYLSTPKTKKYFIAGLMVKISGALIIGFIYQFYYDRGGDTYAYFNQSKQIHAAFYEDPVVGVKLLSYQGGNYWEATDRDPRTFKYSSKIRFFKGKSEYFVIRVAGLFGLFCFHAYSSIAILFAFFSYFGMWAAYRTFLKIRPNLELEFAIAFLFLPSVIIWGSGIFKDTITISCVGLAVASFYSLFYERKYVYFSALVLLLSIYVIYLVKIYIVFALLPSLAVWLSLRFKNKIPNPVLRVAVAPVLLGLAISFAYFSAENLAADDRRFSLDQVGERTRINAEYLYYMSNKSQGSGYYLGKLDGSIGSMLRLTPAALNVTLFRPYPWEVKNPLMLLSSLESLFFLIFTLSLFVKPGIHKTLREISRNEVVIFCFLFTLILGAAVGLNSYNFGTLSRYKISLMPFYIAALYLIRDRYATQRKKHK